MSAKRSFSAVLNPGERRAFSPRARALRPWRAFSKFFFADSFCRAVAIVTLPLSPGE
ncbi:MAG: hypothetical protein ACRDYC_04560 [Acidimicrobiales bacterium]